MSNVIRVSGSTKLLAIIGNPVSHSLSPAMHNAAIAALDLDYVYLPLPVQDLKMAITGLGAISSVAGFNVTIPYKQQIIPMLAGVSDIAQEIGAVNTVKRVEAGWIGTNTDMYGFLVPLWELNQSWQDKEVIILGGGGAAKAVLAGCFALGCQQVRLFGRNLERLSDFCNECLEVHPWQEVHKFLSTASLVVNTTPVGMKGNCGSPLTEAAMELLPPWAIAYDLIYTPRPTEFLRVAQRLGLKAIDGLPMLLHQGAKAWEFWTGHIAPLVVMEQALTKAIVDSD